MFPATSSKESAIAEHSGPSTLAGPHRLPISPPPAQQMPPGRTQTTQLTGASKGTAVFAGCDVIALAQGLWRPVGRHHGAQCPLRWRAVRRAAGGLDRPSGQRHHVIATGGIGCGQNDVFPCFKGAGMTEADMPMYLA